MTDARSRFNGFKERAAPIPYRELDEFWSSLEPVVAIEFMIGEWRGGDLPTGHRGDGFLGQTWFGTTFTSADEEFGEVTATMVYDAMPIHDHFKKVDHDAVIAVTNGKGAFDNGRLMYFYLERL
jgi:hypothetical protein